MKITVLTLFPEMFDGPLNHSILKRATEKNLLDISYVDIRDFGIGKHKTVDDTPYGGGVGMVMRVDVVTAAIQSARCQSACNEKVMLLDAAGKKFQQSDALSLAKNDHLIFVCGHYEGVDARIHHYVDEVISIGDYILTGGEIPTMVIVDAVARLIPGVLGKDESSVAESFQTVTENGIEKQYLEYPQYTRPETFEEHKVPHMLLSGNHKEIDKFRKEASEKLTKKIRPDL